MVGWGEVIAPPSPGERSRLTVATTAPVEEVSTSGVSTVESTVSALPSNVRPQFSSVAAEAPEVNPQESTETTLQSNASTVVTEDVPPLASTVDRQTADVPYWPLPTTAPVSVMLPTWVASAQGVDATADILQASAAGYNLSAVKVNLIKLRSSLGPAPLFVYSPVGILLLAYERDPTPARLQAARKLIDRVIAQRARRDAIAAKAE